MTPAEREEEFIKKQEMKKGLKGLFELFDQNKDKNNFLENLRVSSVFNISFYRRTNLHQSKRVGFHVLSF